tara:strand:+ start:830 stop:1159 length:330 start_codon:yes stop_codon:yes gene_type:complete
MNITESQIPMDERMHASTEMVTDADNLARKIAELVGTKMDPQYFYELLQDYSKDVPNGEYGFLGSELNTIQEAFSWIDQQHLNEDIFSVTELDVSLIEEAELYKAYLTY